jgi:hypothetical protein
MTRKLGLLCVATATALLTFAMADDAQAFGRRGNGSCGSNGGYSSNGGSWGSNGGSWGGRRHRNGSFGSFGSNGGSWGGRRNGSCGSHGGHYEDADTGCGSHGGSYSGNGYHHEGEVVYGDEDRGYRETREARRDSYRVEHEAEYREGRAEARIGSDDRSIEANRDEAREADRSVPPPEGEAQPSAEQAQPQSDTGERPNNASERSGGEAGEANESPAEEAGESTKPAADPGI